jgi:cytoskeleton protein RodZ
MPEHDVHPADTDTDAGTEDRDETLVAGVPVVVRRNAGLAALVGAGASAIAIAYLWRATQSAAPLDWVLCLVMALVAAAFLANLVDARTPLLVADDLGVRIRLGNQWRGLPWDAVGKVVVQPRRGLVHDGRLMFSPHSLSRALDGLDARGRRAAALNQKVYGVALAVPMGISTRVSAQGPELADRLSALAQGRADVVLVEPERPAAPAAPVETADSTEPERPEPVQMARSPRQAAPPREPAEEPRLVEPAEASPPKEDETPEPPARRSLLGGIGTIVSRVAKGRSRDVDVAKEAPQESPPVASPAPALNAAVPLRETRPGLRAEVTRDAPATVLGNAALLPDAEGHRNPLPEGRELRRPGSVDLEFEAPAAASGRVRPISSLGDPVEPLVIDDFVTEPAYDPVIGPELAAARTRVGLSVDELAERTRIRPHVIESIEVDDFAPCGGDFYARGHLRTLARVLGKDPAPLLAQFDERYATAPINARRVFEAELATGMTGSMRSTIGGPNWSLLIGVVLVLVMTWGVVRLFASEPQEQLRSPVPALNGSAGVHRSFTQTSAPAPVIAQTPKPLGVTLVGAQGDSRVVVRDRAGKVVWAGQIVLGEKRTLQATPPVRVQARHGSAISVQVNGKDRGPIGELDEPARRTFHRHR